MIAVGIDPGLASTGIAFVESAGPSLPRLLAAMTVRQVKESPDRPWVLMGEAVRAVVLDSGFDAELVAIESFEYRPYLATKDGVARRVPESAQMGRLVERISLRLELSGFRIVEVSPAESKAGFPAAERDRRRLLPSGLANRHERDAFLAVNHGLTVFRSMAGLGVMR